MLADFASRNILSMYSHTDLNETIFGGYCIVSVLIAIIPRI